MTELMNNEHIPLFEDAKVDMIQIGARNMQNFELLKAVGKLKTPVLLKRGLSSTLEELVMSAEYIMAEGNPNVVLCERGIRTFETSMRNTLDISAVPMLKKMTHLPVVIDPSHAAGIAWMVPAAGPGRRGRGRGRPDDRDAQQPGQGQERRRPEPDARPVRRPDEGHQAGAGILWKEVELIIGKKAPSARELATRSAD